MTFGEKLKAARIESGLKQSELAKKLNTTGNTISNWENNVSKPDLDTLSFICGILHVTASYFLEATIPEDEVSIPELKLVKKYRFISKYSPDGAVVVDTVLDREYSIAEKLKEQSKQIQNMNMEVAEEIVPMRFLSYYQRMASAGSGEFLFSDIPTEVIAVPDTPLSRKADFVIGVNGHSMEDTFFDGDKVLVEKTHDVHIGEIGIFIRDKEECFIKEAGENRLISHNTDKERYPDIIPDERGIDTIGRVLGKVGE